MPAISRPKRSIPVFIVMAALVLGAVPAFAQTVGSPAHTGTGDLSDVRLFKAWTADAVFTPGVDLEPLFEYSWYDGPNVWFGGVRTAIWVADRLEMGGRIGAAGLTGDGGESGFADLDIYGRYRLPIDFSGAMALGGEVRVPTGKRNAGQDNTFVRFFGAMRQNAGGAFTFTANLGFEYFERFGDDANGITVGFGSLIPTTDNLTTIVEFNLRTAFEDAMFTGGLDYELPPGGHLRGAVGVGLRDESPDAEIQFSLALPVF